MRFIGIRHRTKKTAEGEARPTQLAILSEEGDITLLNLADDDAELDWLQGRFPTAMRAVTPEDTIADFPVHQVTWQRLKKGESTEGYNTAFLRFIDREWYVAKRVPAAFDGFMPGDRIAMTLGGSGDRFAYALSRRGDQIGATVFRLPPAVLKTHRMRDKDEDALTLAELGRDRPELFYSVTPRDRALIRLRERLTLRMDTMKARIGCEQRLRQHFIGQVFCTEEGGWPEGSVEQVFDNLKATSRMLQELVGEEKARNRDVEAEIKGIDVYNAVFAPIEGVGPLIAARIIAAVGDIRRFQADPDDPKIRELRRRRDELIALGKFEDDRDKVQERVTGETTFFQTVQMVRSWKQANGKEEEATALDEALATMHHLRIVKRSRRVSDFKKFCGVHVLEDGTFPRRRRGQNCNWHPDVRQALYLLGEQFNKRPDSVWGKVLRAYKAKFRLQYPQPVEVETRDRDGKPKKVKRYSDGHIHRMGTWRTLTRFTEWLFWEWQAFERKRETSPIEDPETALTV